MPELAEVRIVGLPGMPEVRPGDDVARLILGCALEAGFALAPGDIVVVTHKVVSKSEGRLVDLATVEPSPFARGFAERHGKDPRHVEIVLRESARVVRMDRGLIISEHPLGLIMANAGVDASNVPGDDIICLLPVDPDASAAALRRSLVEALGFDIAVIITDSFGRPWREGITNVAIGISGLMPIVDYRGLQDDHGLVLQASLLAVADEVAAASELVMGKLDRVPVAVVRGYAYVPGEGTGRSLVRDPGKDMFR